MQDEYLQIPVVSYLFLDLLLVDSNMFVHVCPMSMQIHGVYHGSSLDKCPNLGLFFSAAFPAEHALLFSVESPCVLQLGRLGATPVVRIATFSLQAGVER